ncbi:MAG: zinc-dependent peptidase [Bacteroidia bacterium]|nr:zinc-dependent peptidase [Bacteroidia bacterium]
MMPQADIELKESSLHYFYSEYFAYYTTLNSQWQQVFVERCLKFIEKKTIIGAEGFKPDNRVKAIIAACAVQLTIGLTSWDLDYFETIIVHPGDFDDKASGLKFRGETNLQGFIRLSWKGFLRGYKISDDNINLGLHEFAHALRINDVKSFYQDYFFDHFFSRWLAAAMEAFYNIRNNKQTLFRKYGGTNINEFISVCIEHYFESPLEIKKEYPYLYYCTAILLNQQTTNKITEVNVRKRLLNELNALQQGFTAKIIKSNALRTNSFPIVMVILVPFLLTAFVTGLFSGGSIFFEMLIAIIYLRFDYRYTKIHVHKQGFTISKGFFIFKNRSKYSFPTSNLVSLRMYNRGKEKQDWEVIFYNSNNDHFYEETILEYKPLDTVFVAEIYKNKIAYFTS